MNVDLTRLAAVLSERLHQGLRELVPLGIPCTWPVFRAVADGGREMFVKLTGRPWWYPFLKPILPFLSEATNDRIYGKFK